MFKIKVRNYWVQDGMGKMIALTPRVAIWLSPDRKYSGCISLAMWIWEWELWINPGRDLI